MKRLMYNSNIELGIFAETRRTQSAIADFTSLRDSIRSDTSNAIGVLSDTFIKRDTLTQAAVKSVISDLNAISVRVENHADLTHASHQALELLRTEMHEDMRQIKIQIDKCCSVVSLASATGVPSNSQVSVEQIREIFGQATLHESSGNLTTMRRLQYRCSRQSSENNLLLPAFFQSPRLKAWSRSQGSAIIVIEGSYSQRTGMQLFGMSIISYLAKISVPVVWVMDRLQLEDLESKIFATSVIQCLVKQALIQATKLHTEALLAKVSALIAETQDPGAFQEILGTALSTLPKAYLVIDLQLLHRSASSRSWPDYFLALLKSVQDRSSTSVVKILLINYTSSSKWRPSDRTQRNVTLHVCEAKARARVARDNRKGIGNLLNRERRNSTNRD